MNLSNSRPKGNDPLDDINYGLEHDPALNQHLNQPKKHRGTQTNTVPHSETQRTQRTQNSSESGPYSPHSTLCSTAPSVFPSREYRKAVFELARGLKADLADADPISIRGIVRQLWETTGKDLAGNKAFDDVLVDFWAAWERVKYPSGSGPMDEILARAKSEFPPLVAARYEPAELRLLICVCRELQRDAGSQPFYLCCRTAGRMIGVDHKRAWQWLKLLVRERVLQLVALGKKGRGNEPGSATEYHYIGDEL